MQVVDSASLTFQNQTAPVATAAADAVADAAGDAAVGVDASPGTLFEEK